MSDIVIAGGSGLVGGHLLDVLSGRAGQTVHALLRRPIADRPGVTQHSADPAQWPAAIAAIRPTTIISTLGTTIAQAGSQAAFRAIDYDLVIAIARAARNAEADHAIIVSSVGASASARNFYLRTKGETETAFAAMGFARLDILRPGLLLGNRSGPARPAERIGMALAPLTNLLTPRAFDRYRAVEAATVARAIAALIERSDPGQFIHHNREMRALSD
jgi:uncharacterized protein YbjT (DUF2867 family)